MFSRPIYCLSGCHVLPLMRMLWDNEHILDRWDYVDYYGRWIWIDFLMSVVEIFAGEVLCQQHVRACLSMHSIRRFLANKKSYANTPIRHRRALTILYFYPIGMHTKEAFLPISRLSAKRLRNNRIMPSCISSHLWKSSIINPIFSRNPPYSYKILWRFQMPIISAKAKYSRW